MNLDGNCQTFMLNDSTVCTSTENVLRTANEKATLKAQKTYLLNKVKQGQHLAVENKDLKHDLNATRRRLLLARISKPVYFFLGALTVYIFKP